MEHRNRSIPQLATDASSTVVDGAPATPQGNNHDILREVAEHMKRTLEDIEQQMQHSEGAALHAVIESAGGGGAFVSGARTERDGTPQEAANLQDLRTGGRAAAAVSSSQRRRSSSAPPFRRCSSAVSSSQLQSMKKRRSAVTGSGCEGKLMATGVAPNRGAGTLEALSSAALLELEEAQRKHPYVSLWGARHRDRWCLPGVGGAPGYLVPVHKFRAEQIVNRRYLLKLTWTKHGLAPLEDRTQELVRSPRPVSAFRGKDNTMYMYGSLANIADDKGRVFVFFDDVSPPAPFKEIPCADLEHDVPTPHSSSSDSERPRFR